MKNYNRGFTALELLVVIGIMAILISLVLASFNSAKKNVGGKEVVTKLQTIQVALEQYKAICRTYPKTLDLATNNAAAGYCSSSWGDIMPGGIDLSDVRYNSMTLPTNNSTTVCEAYHMGISVDPDSSILNDVGDADFIPLPGAWKECDPSGQVGDMGTSVYDVVSPGVTLTNPLSGGTGPTTGGTGPVSATVQ